jgi:deoxyribodipyrimidine photo-lyase
MRNLKATGHISGRGRRLVASYLCLDLKVDWRYGAAWFEERLIDHDTCSNYGNWAFQASIGPQRVEPFNMITQNKKFSPNGEYIRKWVPEISKLPRQNIHQPWLMSAEAQEAHVKLTGEGSVQNSTLA